MTSTNYDDKKDRITGGTNGLGIKIVSIFSKKTELETVYYDVGGNIDKEKKYYSYKQHSRNNLLKVSKPEITSST